MEKQFINSILGACIDALHGTGANGYGILKKTEEAGNVTCVLWFYHGDTGIMALLYNTVAQAENDVILAREVIGDLVNLFPETVDVKVDQPTDLNVVNGVTLPADAKLDTETPSEIKSAQLAADIGQFEGAGLTAYNIGVNESGAYILQLYRGNSIAFEYPYPVGEDRANDMAVVLDRLPNLQFIGGPEYVS